MSGSTIGAPVGSMIGGVVTTDVMAERQALALERIADTLETMLAVMLADEAEEPGPDATLDDRSDPRDMSLAFTDSDVPHGTL